MVMAMAMVLGAVLCVVGRTDAKKETGTSSVVVVAPVATTEDDDDEDDATINKWSKFRVKALKFNESTYFGYIVLFIIFIGSIALVRNESNTSLNCGLCMVMWQSQIAEIATQPQQKNEEEKNERPQTNVRRINSQSQHNRRRTTIQNWPSELEFNGME